MKLKKASRKAYVMGYSWIAVDRSGSIYAYTERPSWSGHGIWCGSPFQKMGNYRGSKMPRDTIRRVDL